jgi:hypothetical protein
VTRPKDAGAASSFFARRQLTDFEKAEFGLLLMEIETERAKQRQGSRTDLTVGLQELGGRFAKAGDGQPRIFVSKKCVNLISELMEYKEEVKENDHACFVAGTVVSTHRAQPGCCFAKVLFHVSISNARGAASHVNVSCQIAQRVLQDHGHEWHNASQKGRLNRETMPSRFSRPNHSGFV